MAIAGLHLTQIGEGAVLLEPAKSLNIQDPVEITKSVTAYLIQAGASRLYYDLSNLPLIDQLYCRWLDTLARSAQVINVQMICINMQPTAAFTLAKFIRKMPAFKTALSI
jgi:rsbT antagonist protein RsbS